MAGAEGLQVLPLELLATLGQRSDVVDLGGRTAAPGAGGVQEVLGVEVDGLTDRMDSEVGRA